MRATHLMLFLACLLAGCGTTTPTAATPTHLPTLGPTPVFAPTLDSLFASDGGGEPRSPGYWLIWNSHAPDNMAATAAANGGRQAGWYLVDDLLADPGLWIGDLKVNDCPQALQLLQARSLDGAERNGDLGYLLAAELLTAQLNLESGAESCLAVVQAVLEGQSVLKEVNFDGQHAVGLSVVSNVYGGAEQSLASLQQYNRGELCR